MAFGSSGAGLWDGVLLRWCWVEGWRSLAVVLGCGISFCSSGAGLWDGERKKCCWVEGWNLVAVVLGCGTALF